MYLIKTPACVAESGVAKTKSQIKPIDSRIYRYWQALYMSFYSKRLYVDVGKRWKGIGILYFVLVIAVFSIPFALRISSDFNRTFNDQIIEPLLQLPKLYLQNGLLTFDKPMPYLIKNKKEQVVLIVDTTGQINNFNDSRYPYLTILINKDKMAFRIPTPELFNLPEQPPNKGIPTIQQFAKNTNLIFDGKKFVQTDSLSRLKTVSQMMIYPIVVVIIFSILLVIFLVLAFLGQVFSRIFFAFPLTFKTASRLFMVAATPMLLLLIMMLTLNIMFHGLGIILLAVLTAYFSFALYSLRSESRQVVNQ